jgi:hypothetical protein
MKGEAKEKHYLFDYIFLLLIDHRFPSLFRFIRAPFPTIDSIIKGGILFFLVVVLSAIVEANPCYELSFAVLGHTLIVK